MRQPRIFLLVCAASCLIPRWVAAGDSERGDKPRGTSLLRQALEAELSGENGKRQELLSAALRENPDDAAARRHAGFVRVGDEWLQVQIAEDQAAREGLIFDYRKLRAQYAGTAQGHVALARWCRKNKLREHELLHWAAVLSFDPANRDARSRLGIREYRGMLLTKQQVEEHKKSQRAYEDAMDHWKPLMRRWRKAMEGSNARAGEDAVAELRLVDDIRALPALDEVFAEADANLLIEVVGVAGSIPDEKATNLLVRYALWANSGTVRDAAATELGKRSVYGFAPALLANLRASQEFTYYVTACNDVLSYGVRSISDSPSGELTIEKSLTTYFPNRRRRGPFVGAGLQTYRQAQEKQAQLSQLARSVEAANDGVEEWNQRVIRVLRLATHQELDDKASSWWLWWQEHNELYTGRVREPAEIKENRVAINLSCFLAGTPVWTETGPIPIEKVRIGDRVLSQNVATGELGYRFVLQTTVRPPSTTTRLGLRGEEIVATLGHPLWVNGIGWLMAKECHVGDRLHGVHGAVPIDYIKEGPEAHAYNLVVDGWNTYFIASRRVLVHDNQPRRVTRTVLPGYVGD